MFKHYLQLFRAQTYPATLLCILVPYLYNHPFDLTALIILILALPIHYFSFGHNSLMDTYGGHDVKDTFKKHHPLVSGIISMNSAHNVIHSGIIATVILLSLLTLTVSANKLMSLLFLLLYFVFGHGYNDGLGKSTVHSYLPISLCFTSLAGYGWFMSHSEIDMFGSLLLLYIFLTILFQIAWEGNLKDISSDRVNLLRKLGVKGDFGDLYLGKVSCIGVVIKAFNIAVGIFLAVMVPLFNHVVGLIWLILVIIVSTPLIGKHISLSRGKILLFCSLTEITTIYAMLFIAVNLSVASLLAVYGVVYFFVMNKILWGVWYPKV